MASSTGSVVVGIDGSDSALRAARWAGAVAERFGAPLQILHALPMIGRNLTQSAGAMVAAMMAYQRDSAEIFLKAAADAVSADRAGLTITTASSNEPADEALIAASAQARLVVLGGKTVTPTAALLLGSTSLAVATHAACPVVAFRGDRVAPGAGPIVVGVDDSPAAETALAAAFDLADRLGSPLRAVRSLSFVVPAETGVTMPFMIDWAGLEAAELAELTEAVDTQNQRHPGVAATCFVEPVSPGKALMRHADEAELVVVGTRGRNALAGILLGSTTLNMLHHSAIPVMVCRAPADGGSRD
ncbi:universal stress protein [Mycolicibacterium sp. XJ870]